MKKDQILKLQPKRIANLNLGCKNSWREIKPQLENNKLKLKLKFEK